MGIRYLIILMGLCPILANSAYGQQNETSSAIPEVRLDNSNLVETPTHSPKDYGKTPFKVEKLRKKEIQEKKMSRSAPEILKEVPSVLVQKTSQGQGSPYIRGFTGFRTLTLIDGIRLNNSVWREGPNQYLATVDPAIAESVELVKGPSSVLYGSDAIGGTLNFLTNPLTLGRRYSRIRYQYGTADLRNIYRLEHVNGSGRTKFLIGGSYRSFGDVIAGGDMGRQPYTSYDEYAGDIKVRYQLPGADTLWLVLQKHQQNQVPRTHKTLFARSYEGTAIGSEKKRELDQGRELAYLRWTQRKTQLFESSAMTLYWHHHTEEQFRIKSNDSSDRQGFDLGASGLLASGVVPTSVGRWTLGLEAVQESVDSFKKSYNADGSFNSESIQGPVGDEAKYLTAAVFVQNEIEVAESTSVILGARYSHNQVKVGRYQDPVSGLPAELDKDFGAGVGSLRVQHNISGESAVYGGISQGYRAPNLSDLTRLDTARSNEIETPAPNLDSESFLTYELGYRCSHEDMSMEVSTYYTDIKDMIIRRPTGVVISGDDEVTKANSGNGFVYGVELSGQKKWNQWQVSLATSWMKGEADTYPTSANVIEREPLSRLMPVTTHLGLSYQVNDGAWVETRVTNAAKADELSSRDKSDSQRIPSGGTPGYTTVDLKGGWELNSNLSLTAGVENIGDVSYRVHGSGSNEAGRNFLIGMEGTF